MFAGLVVFSIAVRPPHASAAPKPAFVCTTLGFRSRAFELDLSDALGPAGSAIWPDGQGTRGPGAGRGKRV
jgi:hypothetical protein